MKSTVFQKVIKYASKNYCVVPYELDDVCLCIADNIIIGLRIDESYNLYSNEIFKQVVIQGREAFTTKTLNRKETFSDLEYKERDFFKQIFELAREINELIAKNPEFASKRERLIEVLEDGIIGQQFSAESLGDVLSELTEHNYSIRNNRIYCNNIETNIFNFCMDAYALFKENKENKKMGLFDEFNDESQRKGEVINYVEKLTHDKLVNAIKSEYLDIKGTCKKVPQMGEYGSFEFAGALLLWRYAKSNVYGSRGVAFGQMMILLGDTIGCAFNGMPAGEWSDKMDVVINNSSAILSYSEWSEIYRYLKYNFEREIHSMEFNNGTYSELQKEKYYAEFIVRYNGLPNFNATLNYYTKQGMHIRECIPFRIND